mmetsp:Transcript_54773/g.138348  ORF Transcript_54773/g.138348 Transcript_54773/m.138348 type:complete len:297 (-) Transcript_54773:81-971(-)
MWKRRRSQTLVAIAATSGLQWSLLVLTWSCLAGEVIAASALLQEGKLASAKSVVANPSASPQFAGYRALIVQQAPQALRRQPQTLLSSPGRRLRAHRRPAYLTYGMLSLAKAEVPAVPRMAETTPPLVAAFRPPKAALPKGSDLPLLHHGVQLAIATAEEHLGGTRRWSNPKQNGTNPAAGHMPEHRSGTTSTASFHHDLSRSGPGGGSGIALASNRSMVAFDNGTGDGKSEEDMRRQDDTVGSELRQRERDQFLGLPKLFWALVADVVAMGAFVLCIPWILHIARRRRASPAPAH